MKNFINFLKDIEQGVVPIRTSLVQDFIDVFNWSPEKRVDRDTIRNYLMVNNKYKDEDDLEVFERDIYTQYLYLHKEGNYKTFIELINEYLFDNDKRISREKIIELNKFGYKVYPLSYGMGNKIIYSIITKRGHIILGGEDNDRQ